MITERVEPGIDIKRLAAGIVVLVETETAVYELLVVRPELGIVEVSSSDRSLHKPTIAQFRGSLVPEYGDEVGDWIGKGLCLAFRFQESYHISTPVVSALVRGSTWNYSVF